MIVELRWVRVAVWTPAHMADKSLRPMLMVVAENDLTVPVEQFVEGLNDVPAEGFITLDTFDGPDEVEHATLTAAREFTPEQFEDERNMAMLYFWSVSQLRIVRVGGILAMPDPAPLSAEQVTKALHQLAKHRASHHRTVVTPTADGKMVTLKPNREITVEEM